MARAHGWFLVSGMVAGVGGAAPASAEDYDLHLVVTGNAAATDNVFSAPDEGMASRDADLIYTLTPGLVASYGTPNTTHELTFNVSFNGYVDHSEAWGIQLFGDYRAAIALTPLSDLALSAGVSRGSTNALATTTAPSDGTAAPAQGGSVDSLSFTSGEGLSHSFSPEMRGQQNAGASYTIVTDSADNEVKTLQVGLGLGLDRTFQLSSAGIDAGINFLDFDRGTVMPMPMPAEPDRRADGRLGLRWRRDLSQRWSVGADGGVTAVIPIDGDADVIPVPTASVHLSYVPVWGTASLQVGRSVSANPFIAQQTVAESAVLSLNLPLPWLNAGQPSDTPEWTASAAVAGARSRVLNMDSGDLTGELVNGLLDLGLSYVPREEMTFAMRYQYTRQKTLEAVAVDGMDGMTDLPSLSRSTLLFAFTYRYPGRIVSNLPSRQILRVDQEAPLQERNGEQRRR
jgi:hypothetical protein